MTYDEMNYESYKMCNLFHSFLFDEYNDNNYMCDDIFDKILSDHNVSVIESDFINEIFIINITDNLYTLTYDSKINDVMYIKMIKAFTIGYLSINSNIIFNNKKHEFNVFIFSHDDTFNKDYNSYFLGCLLLMPSYDVMCELIVSNMNDDKTINIDRISKILNIDPIIIKLIFSYNKLIKL